MGAADDLVWILAIIGWCWIGLIVLGVFLSDLETTFWLLVIFVGLPLLLLGVIGFFYFLPCLLKRHPYAKVSYREKGEWVYRHHKCQHCNKTVSR